MHRISIPIPLLKQLALSPLPGKTKQIIYYAMPLFAGENANDSFMFSRCFGCASHACLKVPTIASKCLSSGKSAQVLMAQAPISICTPNVISKVTPMTVSSCRALSRSGRLGSRSDMFEQNAHENPHRQSCAARRCTAVLNAVTSTLSAPVICARTAQ